MRADVGDGAQLAALVRLESPVPVGRQQQPVLQIAAVHVPDLAELTALDARARLLHERVEADVEVGAVHEPARVGELDELAPTRPR